MVESRSMSVVRKRAKESLKGMIMQKCKWKGMMMQIHPCGDPFWPSNF